MSISAHDVASVRAALDVAEREIQAQMKARFQLESKLKSVQQELKKTIRTLAEREKCTKELEKDHEKQSHTLLQLQDRLNASNAKNKSLEKQIASQDKKLKDTEEKQTITNAAIENMHGQILVLQNMIVDARQKLVALSYLQEKVSQMEGESATWSYERSALQSTIDNLQTELDRAKLAVTEARAEAASLRARTALMASKQFSEMTQDHLFSPGKTKPNTISELLTSPSYSKRKAESLLTPKQSVASPNATSALPLSPELLQSAMSVLGMGENINSETSNRLLQLCVDQQLQKYKQERESALLGLKEARAQLQEVEAERDELRKSKHLLTKKLESTELEKRMMLELLSEVRAQLVVYEKELGELRGTQDK